MWKFVRTSRWCVQGWALWHEAGNSEGRKWWSGFSTGNPAFARVPASSLHSGSHGAFPERTIPQVNERQESPHLWPALGPQHHSSAPPRDFPFPLSFGGPSIVPLFPQHYSSILRKSFSIRRGALWIPFPHFAHLCAHCPQLLLGIPLDPFLLSSLSDINWVFFCSPTSPSLSAPSCQWQLDFSQSPLSCHIFRAKGLQRDKHFLFFPAVHFLLNALQSGFFLAYYVLEFLW